MHSDFLRIRENSILGIFGRNVGSTGNECAVGWTPAPTCDSCSAGYSGELCNIIAASPSGRASRLVTTLTCQATRFTFDLSSPSRE